MKRRDNILEHPISTIKGMYSTFTVSQRMFMTWWCYLSHNVRQQTDNYGISRIIAALRAIRSLERGIRINTVQIYTFHCHSQREWQCTRRTNRKQGHSSFFSLFFIRIATLRKVNRVATKKILSARINSII